MEKCYEYLGCPNTECSAYHSDNDIPCWEREVTLCNHTGIKFLKAKNTESKEFICKKIHCIYYEKKKNKYFSLT